MMRRIDGSGWLGQSQISTIFTADLAPIALSQFSMMFQIATLPQNVAKGQQ
jgi:type IV pilus assembly protein PilN